ncbi:TspO/MBR family protein [Ruminococcus sp. FC2018]|uniref:TspO/MBR family protein n=1 Tax=Ruminococcus sp. FC2018 TaxID=1410617 RepID=UPI000A47DD94|nr:TspO/MBR family protein [Ruminococcus sp. FC2018]
MELSIKKFINELKFKPFVIFLAIPFAVQLLSYFITKGSMDIYDRVNIPPLSPPSWLFPVVWTILFGLMGISSYLVWNEDSSYTKEALGIYGIQLVFNLCWNVFFFVMETFLVSLIWLVGLLILIIIMIAAFRRISPVAAYLQIPYALWVAFACYLNAGIYYLN